MGERAPLSDPPETCPCTSSRSMVPGNHFVRIYRGRRDRWVYFEQHRLKSCSERMAPLCILVLLVCDLKPNQKCSSVQSEEECVAPNVTSSRIFLMQLKCMAFFSLYRYIVSPIKNPIQVCLTGTCLQTWPRFGGFASFTSDSLFCL